MKFMIEIKCDSAAFHGRDDQPDAGVVRAEVTRIVTKVMAQHQEGRTGGAVPDINGNTVCHWGYRAEPMIGTEFSLVEGPFAQRLADEAEAAMLEWMGQV
jgi:hypothetical protein